MRRAVAGLVLIAVWLLGWHNGESVERARCAQR